MKTVSRAGLIVLVVALGIGGYWLYSTRLASKPAATTTTSYTQIVEVKQGNLSANLTVVGQLDALQRSDLTFERMNGTAKLLTLAVKAGNTVTAGQVLATIDPASYQQVVDRVKSDLQAAEEKLADLKTPVTELKIAKADLAIAKADYQLQQAQDALDTLVNPDLPALQTAVADAQSTLAKAQADLVALQNDAATADKIAKLRDADSKLGDAYNRLAGENYGDTYYQDRLQVAYNKMLDAQDTRVTAEIQQQVNIVGAQLQVRKAKKTLADAQEKLATSQVGGDPLALAKAKSAVRDAEVALATAKDDRVTLTEGTDATVLASAQADVDKKRLAAADAEAALAGTKLTAPFAGTILQTNAAVGDTIASTKKILTVADLAGLQVVASIDETTIKRVVQGQTAQITFDALPGQTLRGQVGDVPLQGALQGGVMVYQVPISLTGAEKLPLLVGMTANVKIQLGQAQNALLIPTLAIQRGSSGYQVLVPNATDPQGAPTAVPVEVGLSDGVNTQIVRGLNLGDKVVTRLAAATTTNQFNQGGPGGGIPPDAIPAGGGQQQRAAGGAGGQ
ncbi:MAG: efflux RND transporter periplasmic adaptor subunit [Chloroflexi bacterium]|nr:efflux RND transporter periplasmic adaptor subunit [Chloroflexota bacterium]